ncbi:hypothetical protein [uncultured Sphingomonas sp.]|uniref:Fur family transcriptional regulator n=1 Tax=uncultured Sphingomonas sp. TaxID=158754 RepID=UPI00262FCD37|nr:hypothetical protein [uncultured Sphingomonas sp.]
MRTDPATKNVGVKHRTLRQPHRRYRAAAVLDAMVMALLTESNQPLTAHDIARRSSEKGSHIKPMQVYRVLDRLDADERIQRVELLSAWLPRHGTRQGFMVCQSCRSVQAFPIDALQVALQRLCRAAYLSPTRQIVETWGLCAECDGQREMMGRSVTTGKGQGVRISGLMPI